MCYSIAVDVLMLEIREKLFIHRNIDFFIFILAYFHIIYFYLDDGSVYAHKQLQFHHIQNPVNTWIDCRNFLLYYELNMKSSNNS